MEHKTTELEPFHAADMNEVVRLRKIEKAARLAYMWWCHPDSNYAKFASMMINLRKALQGD